MDNSISNLNNSVNYNDNNNNNRLSNVKVLNSEKLRMKSLHNNNSNNKNNESVDNSCVFDINKDVKSKENCERCSINSFYMSKAVNSINDYVKILIHKCNSVHYKTNLFNESILNSDFKHSQYYYTLDRYNLPTSIKSSLKNLFVSIINLFIYITNYNYYY